MNSLFNPVSLAVVGASNDPAKWGFWVAAGALHGREQRAVYLINAKGESIQGYPSHPTLTDLPEVPQLVVLCVPPTACTSVIDEALSLGVQSFVVITSHIADQDAVLARIRAAGARIIGPNSLGIYDAQAQLLLAWGQFVPGSMAVVTQSGQLGTEIATLAARSGLGISRFASIGGQSDVRAAEILSGLIDHQATSTVVLYLESFSGGTELVQAMKRLRAAGKPTIVLTTGASRSARKLARSHTGALTSATDTVDAACRAAGAIRLTTPAEVVELAGYLATAWRPRGRRVAIVSDSGGQGGIAADVAESYGLEVLDTSAATAEAVQTILPASPAVSNPVDLAGAGEADLSVYPRTVAALLADDSIDAVVLSGYFGCYGEDVAALVDAELQQVTELCRIAYQAKKPVLVHSMSASSAAVTTLWENWVPVYTSIDSVMRVLARAARLEDYPGRDLPGPSVDSTITPWAAGYSAAREVLTEIGVPVPAGVVIDRSSDVPAVLSQAQLTAPYVLKAGWIEHKTEQDAIALGLPDAAAVTAAHHEMVARLGDGEYLVEEMDQRTGVVEVLIGARQDDNFGPMIMVGAGGTETELYGDTWLEMAPVNHAEALDMLLRLKVAKLLTGWRGKRGVDLDALAATVVAISRLVARRPEIAEIELNPVRATAEGVLAVDALVIAHTDHHQLHT